MFKAHIPKYHSVPLVQYVYRGLWSTDGCCSSVVRVQPYSLNLAFTILWYSTILNCSTILYCIMFYHTILYRTILYYTIIILFHTVMYCSLLIILIIGGLNIISFLQKILFRESNGQIIDVSPQPVSGLNLLQKIQNLLNVLKR